MVAGAAAGCTAYDPQGAAQQYAPSYYNQSYDQLSAQQKMQLEDHLSNQSNQAWRTSAQVVSSVGHLAQGTGFLLVRSAPLGNSQRIPAPRLQRREQKTASAATV